MLTLVVLIALPAMLPLPYLGLALLGFAIALKLVQKIKTAYFTPLAKIPGPWYAPLTNFGLKRAVIGARRCHYVHEMHQKYGPIVRLSPDEVAIAGTKRSGLYLWRMC